MKFKAAVVVSILLHISLCAVVLITPQKRSAGETIFYADLLSMGGKPGGDGRGGGGGVRIQEPEPAPAATAPRSGGVKNLVVEKSHASSLRFPDKESRKKPEKEGLVSVVRKPLDTQAGKGPVRAGGEPDVLSTGIGTGGYGDGSGTGGGGNGAGGGGYFPYAYYIEALRNKISSSWYRSLVTPGLRGRFLTAVRFQIRRNGMAESIEVEQASGVESLDLSALRAVQNAAPFPPLPADFPSQALVVHFEFVWEK